MVSEAEILRRAARLREQAATAASRDDVTDEANRLSADFFAFVEAAWSVADPSPFIPSWHVRVMCEALQDLVEDWNTEPLYPRASGARKKPNRVGSATSVHLDPQPGGEVLGLVSPHEHKR